MSSSPAEIQGSQPWTEQQRLEYLWSILEHTSGWIQAADNKAAATLAINSITIGFLFSSGFDLATKQATVTFSGGQLWFVVIVSVLGILFLLISLLSALLCLMGRTGINNIFGRHFEGQIERPSDTLIFFGAVSRLPPSTYAEQVEQMDHRSSLRDLSRQIHVLARIAAKKYVWLNRAYVCLVFSILSFSALAIMVSLSG